MSRVKNLLDDLDFTLTPEERAKREQSERSELDERREENLAQMRAFMPQEKLRATDDQSFPT